VARIQGGVLDRLPARRSPRGHQPWWGGGRSGLIPRRRETGNPSTESSSTALGGRGRTVVSGRPRTTAEGGEVLEVVDVDGGCLPCVLGRDEERTLYTWQTTTPRPAHRTA
jgi:hypothetical protein